MILEAKCQTCDEPTKYVTGVWDGPRGNHGCLYDCRNQECAVQVMKEESKRIAREHQKGVKKENWDNNVFPMNIKAAYRAKGMCMGDVHRLTGIALPILSDYMAERVALPVETYCAIMEKIAGAPIKGKAY